MTAQPSPESTPFARAAARLLPAGVDRLALLPLLAGFAVMYVPMFLALANSIWASDEQGHGPIILAVSLWLVWRAADEIVRVSRGGAAVSGSLALVAALLLFVLGRTQDLLAFEVLSMIAMLAALLLLFCGWSGLRRVWFPLFFLLFMVPLPEVIVAAVTSPLKSAVSSVASSLLYAVGYPVGRSGVVLTVGQYQLMVADACAGLNSMFTLEALGMLYMNLMKYTSVPRNTTLAVLLIPIAFVANVIRVLILVLVTYYFGDAAGQGFVHGFAGIVLFLVALGIMLVVDRMLGLYFDRAKA
ncbi:MAG: exosortase B [Rubrivivax sp.]